MRPMSVREVPGPVDQLRLEAELPAPPERVFAYFVEPELLGRWWAPQAEVDGRPGGDYVLSWPIQKWHLRGEYTEFDPPQRIAFSWSWDHEPDLPTRHVAIVLEATSEATTRLRLIHGAYGASRVEQADRASHREGWLHFLPRLAAELERGQS